MAPYGLDSNDVQSVTTWIGCQSAAVGLSRIKKRRPLEVTSCSTKGSARVKRVVVEPMAKSAPISTETTLGPDW